MAEEETFIMVSLEEQKSKDLAQVISNDTSRKILNFLGKKEAGEAEISKELNIPISTVHYNVQQLIKSGLLESKEFKYSDKGKEVNIYTVSKKIIVIAPSNNKSMKDLLKGMLPFFGISIAISFLIQIIANNIPSGENAPMLASQKIAEASGTQVIAETIPSVPLYGLWFFFGSMFILITYMMYLSIKKK